MALTEPTVQCTPKKKRETDVHQHSRQSIIHKDKCKEPTQKNKDELLTEG